MKRSLFLVLALVFPLVAAAQHDAQRNAVQALAREKWNGFERAFRNPRVDAGMEETRFVNLLRLLARDEMDAAIRFARESLEAGMDPSRLQAGSGELMTKLRRRPEFGKLPGVADVPPVIHGPMVGSVTATGASVWVRTRGRETLSVVLAEQGGEPGDEPVAVAATAVAATAVATTRAARDYTGRIELDGLEPATAYEGRLLSGDEEAGAFSFTTRPEEGSPAAFEVAFGGGAGFVPEYHRMWDTIRGFEPDALLMLGDNVYIDDPEHAVTQRYCYHRRQSEPGWRALVARTPVYSIYDDHDFGTNDCVPGAAVEKPAWKRDVLEVFRQNWVNPGYGGGREQPGCWYDFSIGDVQFFLLDGRYYRDLEEGSMLGEAQKAWLFDALAESEATFKLLVSPVPFTAGVKPGSRDPWDGYPEEREEIFSFLEEEEIEGVFLVAADRHRTDLRTTERENGYALYEFMSSRLTNRHTHRVVKTPGLVWGYNDTCSFGLMAFDTTADDPQVTFRCIDIDGKERESFVLKRSELER